MTTPILDFVRRYAESGTARLHMPGHKGAGPLGCEALDITEVRGADALWEASGIIAESEANAAALFGARRTCCSTEGSSLCVKAMLFLALTNRPKDAAPLILAARNVHKSFVHAAALLDLEVQWLWPGEGEGSLCACRVTPGGLERALSGLSRPPCGVYVTSPDYLGNELPLAALAEVCHRRGTLLLVDNAHGAYRPFLPGGEEIKDSADLWCGSAHKTLPVLTGGAYLHVGRKAPAGMEDRAKQAMALFGTTSPSYLIMASLDACNAFLAGEGRERMEAMARRLDALRDALTGRGWALAGTEPLKLTLDAAARGWDGRELAEALRRGGVEPEYADPDYVVLMASAHTTAGELERVERVLSELPGRPDSPRRGGFPALRELSRAMTIRQAVFAPSETVTVEEGVGRVCAAPAVACPPAIPIAVSGEVIPPVAVERFRYYGISTVDVVK